LADQKVKSFENQYKTTLEKVETEGIPEDADHEMHENYIEWSYWVGAAKRCKKEIALIQEKLWCQSLNRAVDLSKEQSAGKRNTCNCLAAKTLKF